MRYPGGWSKDRWKVTTPGNYQWHYAKHDNGIMLWLTDPGGRGDNWSVKAGTGTRLGDSTHVASGLANKRLAEGVLEQTMAENPWPDSYRDLRHGGSGLFGGLR